MFIWFAEKHVLRYLKGTLDHGLWYRSDHEFGLYGYSDSDWADSIPDQRSTYGCCFILGYSMVSWSSRKHYCVSLSTTEAKYVAACASSREVVWLQTILSGLFGLGLEVTCIWCDNQSYMKMLETRCSMRGQSISRSNTTLSGIWYRGDQ
jgi:hypothetical protein